MRGTYARALSAPGARRLLLSSLLARLPLGMSLAVLLLVREELGGFGAAGVAVGAVALAESAGGPVLGRLVDRVGQTRVLVPTALAHGAFLLALVAAARAGASLPAVAGLAGAAGLTLPPVAPCLRALWPDLVPDAAAREAAFALDATTQEVIWTSGPLLVGGIVAVLSPATAVVAMAVVTVAGTLWFAASPRSRTWRPLERRAAGALRSRGLRACVAAAVGAGLTMGGLEVGLPSLADALGSDGLSGALLAAASFGSLLGGLAYGARAWRTPLAIRLPLLLGAMGLLMAPLMAAGSPAPALALALVSGIACAPGLSCLYALVGRLAPEGAATEAFTWCGSAIGGGIAAGTALGGVLVEHGGPGGAFALSAAAGALAAGLAWTWRGTLAGELADAG